MTDANNGKRAGCIFQRAADTMRGVGADAGKKIVPATATLRPLELQRLQSKEDQKPSSGDSGCWAGSYNLCIRKTTYHDRPRGKGFE